jgi:ABC-2 type transport system permease protein
MSQISLLGRRSVREIPRLLDATIPTLALPLSFLAVTVGQLSRTIPSSMPFLHGQGYAGFQLPVALLFGVCTATSGFGLVNDMDRGYLDKLLVAPIRRSSIILGRLVADLVRGLAISTLVLLAALALGAQMRSGIAGAVVLVSLSAMWGTACAGIAMLIALHTRNVAATSASFLVFLPLLFLTPTFVPFDRLTPLMETLARANPASYVIEGLRSLVLEGWVWHKIAICIGVTTLTGLVLISLAVRAIERYDR